jgi:hypothetical protein
MGEIDSAFSSNANDEEDDLPTVDPGAPAISKPGISE